MVTHPSTNRARRRLTSLIETKRANHYAKLSTELFFVEPGLKVDGRYYHEVLLKKQMLPVICVALPVTRTCFSRTAHRRTVLARQFSCCSRRQHILPSPICGLVTVRSKPSRPPDLGLDATAQVQDARPRHQQLEAASQ